MTERIPKFFRMIRFIIPTTILFPLGCLTNQPDVRGESGDQNNVSVVLTRAGLPMRFCSLKISFCEEMIKYDNQVYITAPDFLKTSGTNRREFLLVAQSMFPTLQKPVLVAFSLDAEYQFTPNKLVGRDLAFMFSMPIQSWAWLEQGSTKWNVVN